MKIFESFLKKNELDLTIKEYLDKINDLVKMEGRFFKCYLPLHQGTYVYGNITLDEKTGILHGESYFIRKLDSQTTIKYKPLWKKVEDIKPFNFEEITEKCFKAISAHCKAVFEVASKVNEIVSKEKYNLFTNNNEKISVDINFNWKTSFNSNDYSENTKISDVFKEINKKETQKLVRTASKAIACNAGRGHEEQKTQETTANTASFSGVDRFANLDPAQKNIIAFDSSKAFDEAKRQGAIGIPCFVLEDGTVTLSPEDAGLQPRPAVTSCRIDGTGC